VNPRQTGLFLALLGILAFCLALAIDPWSRARQTDRSGGLLALLLGDGRRLFANHFFAKADAYFHQGVYPSIFDAPRREEMHMVTAGEEEAEEHDEDHEPGESAEHDAEHCTDPTHNHAEPRAKIDWVAWMNHRLNPTDHAHLGGGDEREMLPWLRMASELDPGNTQNFTIPAYWLRTRLGRVDEAEALLREGLRHNPGRADLLYDLGVIQLENRKDPARARNLLELALARWQAEQAGTARPDNILAEAILARLVLIERGAGNLRRTLEHLEALEKITPRPEPIREQIQELRNTL
jgi:tetratricopeptide (TPR) repeat protein